MKTGYQFMRKAITIVFVFLSTAIIVAQSLSGPDKVKSGGTFDYSFEDGGNYYQIKRGVFTARYLDNNLIAGEGTSLGDYDYNTAKVEFRNLYAEDKEAEISAVFTETNNHTFTLTKRITILGENPFYLPNSTPKYGEKGYIPILSRVKLPSSYTISWSLSGGSTIVSSNNSLIEVDWNTIGTHVLTALVHYKGKVYTVSKNITINPIYRKNPLIVGETAVELNTDIKYNLKAESLSKAQVTWSITGGTIVHKNNTGVVVNWTNKKEGVLSASVNFLDDGLAPYNTELKVAVVPKVVSPYKGTTAANENYIRTVKYLTPIVADINTAVKKTETITYIDALGRPKQQVNVKAGGNKENIITHIEYDVLGRQTKEFLPYAFTTSNNLYRTQPASESYAFYNTPKYENTLNPYAEMQFEGNSLNRIIKKAGPGKDWGAHIMDEHTVRTKYDVVKDEDEVMILRKEYDSQTPFHMTVHNTHKGYGKGLYKKVTKNENWKLTDGKDNTIEEYTDYQHRLLLKRTYNKGIPHDTYYVYDDFENLSFVIPPKVTFPISDEAMNNLCYQYKYDSRNRLIEKKLPGKGWEFIVYDNLDRPVLTQDSNLKQKQQWLYTKYDVLGRVAYTGVYVDVIGRSRASAQADIDSHVSGNATRHYEVLGDFSTYAGVPIYYGNRAYPNSRSLDIFTINYYDRYLDLPIGLENRITTSYGVMSTLNTKGLSTVRKTRVLDTNQWITNVTYYDEKGRVIYVYSKNDYLRTVDIVEHKLDDFTGKVIETKTTHNKEGEDAIESIERFEYDHMDRLLSHTQKLNDQLEERLFRNHYDELGQLSYKLVGNGTKSGYKDVSSGIDIEEDLIRKTGAKGWTAGLATLGSIEKDGYVSFSVVEQGKYYMVGLSKENTDVHYKSIDYAIYIHASKVYIYEKGSFRGVETSYKVGDVFQVERIGSEVFYKKNGAIFYKSTIPSSGSLLGDVSMFHKGGKIRDLKLVDNTKGLQKVDYSYNIRGWLKKINEDGFKDNDLFNFTINYNSIEGNAGA
ncbi:DUF6443 domain-containing protein, partial [Tenacibaculum maritimum]|uniref:DUF6443 domain-containing protein n=1 Tax=Tenacibaculum maritimum TaxID=107401 RepID=UPI003877471E